MDKSNTDSDKWTIRGDGVEDGKHSDGGVREILRLPYDSSQLHVNLSEVSGADTEEWVPFPDYIQQEVDKAIEQRLTDEMNAVRDIDLFNDNEC